MNRITRALMACAVALGALQASPALARNTELHLPLADVLSMPEAQAKLDGSVKFYLAGQKTPKVLKRLQSDTASHKTNGVGKADDVACRWAALSALIALQEKAKALGANAVVDITSFTRTTTTKSATDYECRAGAVVVGVRLKGTYAKVAR